MVSSSSARGEVVFRWLGPSLPSVPPSLGRVDFQAGVPLSPSVLSFTGTRTVDAASRDRAPAVLKRLEVRLVKVPLAAVFSHP